MMRFSPRSIVKFSSAMLTVVFVFFLDGGNIVRAENSAAGKTAAQPCTACHGINGVSISPTIPNLAAQNAKYIEAQLGAFKSDARKHPIMGPIAKRLDKEMISNVAAYFSSLPGPTAAGSSQPIPEINLSRVVFPKNYKNTFTKYMTINFPDREQVRHYYANSSAVEAARLGQPIPNGAVFFTEVFNVKKGPDGKPAKGADGYFIEDKLILHTAMAKEQGWGKDIPELFRNGDWNYALFTPAGEQRTKGFNHAACLACHLPLESKDYLFTLGTLTEKVRN